MRLLTAGRLRRPSRRPHRRFAPFSFDAPLSSGSSPLGCANPTGHRQGPGDCRARRTHRKHLAPGPPVQMKISVVVNSRDEGPWLRETVENLAGTLPADREILVVDDGSVDGSGDFL